MKTKELRKELIIKKNKMDKYDIIKEFQKEMQQPTMILNKCDVGTNPAYVIWLEKKVLALTINNSSLQLNAEYKKGFDAWLKSTGELYEGEIEINGNEIKDGDTLIDIYESIKDDL